MEKDVPLILINEDKLNDDVNTIMKHKKRIKIKKSTNEEQGYSLSEVINKSTNFNLEKEGVHPEIISNIKLSEVTLPGAIISYMMRNGGPASENDIYEYILPKINDLRKSDGGKYKGNIIKVVKSTLYSSGLFYKQDNSFYFREEEGLNYMIRNTEKLLNKQNGTERVFLINKKRKRQYLNLTYRQVDVNLPNVNIKYLQIKNVLDEMIIEMSKNSMSKIRSPFMVYHFNLER
jgi:hypothetical protein